MLGLYGVTGVVLWNVWATNGQRACEEVRGAKFYSPWNTFFGYAVLGDGTLWKMAGNYTIKLILEKGLG